MEFEEFPDVDVCAWVSTRGARVTDGECPDDDSPVCAIVLPDESVTVWAKIPSPGTVTAIQFYEMVDGACPVSCEAEFGCETYMLDPNFCAPCPEEGCE